jgi:transposase
MEGDGKMCIYVRDISNEEGNRLKIIQRRSNNAIKVKRAQIVLASAQGMQVPEICRALGFERKYVGKTIHRFNDLGFEALESQYRNCGKKPKFGKKDQQKIVDVALSKPQDLGLPFTEWSLPKLRSYLISSGEIESISIETIRRILNENGIRYRHTKTWKESNDPDFEIKKKNHRTISRSTRRR